MDKKKGEKKYAYSFINFEVVIKKSPGKAQKIPYLSDKRVNKFKKIGGILKKLGKQLET